MSVPEQPRMFDRRFITAVLLIGFAWMGWQSYLTKKYPQAYRKTSAPAESVPAAAQKSAEVNSTVKTAELAPHVEATTPQVVQSEKLTNFEDENISLSFSSTGMAFKNVQLKKFSDRQNQPIIFANDNGLSLFETKLLASAEPLYFNIEKTADHQFTGTAEIKSLGLKVIKNISIDSSKFTFETSIRVEGQNPAFGGLAVESVDKVEPTTSSFFKSRFEHQEFFVNHEGSTSRIVADTSKPTSESYNKALVASFGSQYFGSAILDSSEIIPEFKASISGSGRAVGTMEYRKLSGANAFNLKYTAFIGPKSFDLLKSISSDMTDIVNFGFFTSIAKGIFWLMKSIHSFISNWGVAIVILTLLVRLIVLPVNIMSYKQMKTMARIQPQIKALRERYKDDAQRLNQEMLNLMKENKANPLGGCLPMLLQIPIFFALYQVIGQSIELYKAPFAFWIQDLSLKDPYFVLPVLMGLTMFIQQKITPNNMDPAQQKVMMFMPLIFCFLMFSLPSGLTLYIFISSVFGILQQIYFTKENSNKVIVKS
jgi:YidC/Oxa1 family membrane protein insertase